LKGNAAAFPASGSDQWIDVRPMIGVNGGTGIISSHANLSDLAWMSSGHSGTADRYIGFDGGGLAQERTFAQVLADLGGDPTSPYDLTAKTVKTTAKAKAYLGTIQEDITANRWIRVDLDTESYDPGANFDTGLLGSGTATGTTAGHLIDAGYDFAGAGIKVGMRIKNTTDTTYTYITAVAVGDLTLRDNIFVNGETWEVQAARFIVPVTGYYQINANIAYTSVIADKRYFVVVYKNGAYAIRAELHSSNTEDITIALSDILYLTAGDYLELMARQSGANTVDIVNAEYITFMSVHLLSV